MKKYEKYVESLERAQTQRAITAAKTKGPDKSIILVSTVRRNGTYPEVRIIQHPKNNCQDLTLIIEEVETTNCADIDRQSIQV